MYVCTYGIMIQSMKVKEIAIGPQSGLSNGILCILTVQGAAKSWSVEVKGLKRLLLLPLFTRFPLLISANMASNVIFLDFQL